MWLVLVLAAFVLTVLMLVAAAVAAVTIAVTVVAHLLPVLLILAGVWLLMRALRGPTDRHRTDAPPRDERRHRRAPRPEPAEQSSAQSAAAPTQPPAPQPRELPVDVQVKVEQIRRKVEVLLGFADRFPPFSHDLYIVRQTAAEYLPRTIAAYRAVPGDGDPVIGTTGRTALEELRAQLNLLDAKLDDITQSLQRQDLDRMVANRRFLEERFGLAAGTLGDVPADPGDAPAELGDLPADRPGAPERPRGGPAQRDAGAA